MREKEQKQQSIPPLIQSPYGYMACETPDQAISAGSDNPVGPLRFRWYRMSGL